MKLVLTGCGKTKLAHRAPAGEMYISGLCKLRAEYARAEVADEGASWMILSAEHGLVDPAAEIDPYETSLAGMSAADRAAWVARVCADVVAVLAATGEKLSAHRVEIHAGREYARNLARMLACLGVSVHWWTEGMEIGEQQQAYCQVRGAKASRLAKWAARYDENGDYIPTEDEKRAHAERRAHFEAKRAQRRAEAVGRGHDEIERQSMFDFAAA